MTETRGIVTVASVMSSAEAAPHPEGRPSVFLSYASEDRAAVRKLRDALEAAGVDAWYDENELTGGDAWDAKIRHQIRECTYFMPVISARASARLEGYFRREWRFALERMLDMADDVVFLLPVVIDDSNEGIARVPEKFLTVQWLRVKDGDATPAFHELARRLAAGGPERLHQAPRSGERRPIPPRVAPHYLPPAVETLPKEWWRWPGFFWRKFPRWVRVILWIALIFWALDSCSGCGNSKNKSEAQRAARQAVLEKTTPKKKDPASPSLSPEAAATLATVGQVIEQFGTVVKNQQAKQTDLLIHAVSNSTRANQIQTDFFGKFILAEGVKAELGMQPLQEGETLLDRAKAQGSRLVLQTTQEKNAAGEDVLRVVLLRTTDGVVLSQTDYPATEQASLIAAQAYAQLLPLILKKD